MRLTLRRTGDAPLIVEDADELYSVSTTELGEANRWHVLSLYQSTLGPIIAQIEYRSGWQGELDHDAVVLGGPDEVRAWLRAHDPTAYVMGYPPGERLAGKQQRLLQDIRRRYTWAVTEVLEALAQHLESVGAPPMRSD